MHEHYCGLLRRPSGSRCLEKVVKQNLNVEKTEAAVEEVIGKKKKPRELSQTQQGVSKCTNLCEYHHKGSGNDAGGRNRGRFTEDPEENYIEYRVRIPIGERK